MKISGTKTENDNKTNRGFSKPVTPSKELAAVIGPDSMPRTEITKKLWDYIKANGLQNPTNKRNIIADSKLELVFGKPEVTMFEMTKLVSMHLK
jgi:chromatin remodeling complex protein RSC6